MSKGIGRRSFLRRGAALAGTLLLSGCGDQLSQTGWWPRMLGSAEHLNMRAQRLLASRQPLAPEYPETDISTYFKPNGTYRPGSAKYQALAADHFADWRLQVGGLVEHPMQLSLADLKRLPSRTQITRHDCVEGWSCIGKWKGARLGELLDRARPKPQARYVVFYCADSLDGTDKYYESIDFAGAYHPQTILAYEMNDQPLPIPHGAPIRLRLERQLGYKMAKYVMRIELVENFDRIEGGRGGYWEDRGYEWYAGI